MPATIVRKRTRTATPAKSNPRKSTRKAATPATAKSTARKAAKAATPATANSSTRKSTTAARSVPARKRATTPGVATAPAADAAAPAKPKQRWVVRNSPIHGRGVFAARDIKKHKKVIEYQGDRTSWKNAMKRPPSDPDNPYHTFLFGLDDGRVIDADVGGNEARWINHSCKPNCETEENAKGRVFIRARRKIVAGEELTYDYQLTYDGKMGKKMRAAYACRCGAKNCRGTMLGKDV